ncbi:prostaglandin G/H synthase 1-like isoform X2 [Chiloscyllium plagiosum]|uniref:prostaglandin G/H synthase 1-like isoform X2 n=1 Tax=Chiloscyllium plagiosum TaxID=36176 RepID=UPI001CB86F77|nr:prostaglandin G/H synthase 1-like isoform X2 [Chiloscyllium plagiosum]
MEAARIIFLLVLLCFLKMTVTTAINPCCYYPCQNKGICVNIGKDGYECDCTRTGYYGVNCSLPYFWSRIHKFLKPSPSFMHHLLTHYQWFWNILDGISFIRDSLMRYVLTDVSINPPPNLLNFNECRCTLLNLSSQNNLSIAGINLVNLLWTTSKIFLDMVINTAHSSPARSNLIPSPPTYNSDYDYLSWEGYSNVTYFTRLLPPVPKDCPTPTGTKGYKELPDVKFLAEEFLLRRQFIPDPQGTNLMFAFFAQHFTHQFFRTDFNKGPGFTKALGHGVDLSHIYGDSLERQHQLRLFKDGKLKYQVVNGEVLPPSMKDVPIRMKYPDVLPVEKRLAIGNDLFGLLPGLMMYATIWLREHNRVCDILKHEHPTWNDEQLFQTTRLILIGETIKIVIEDYVQHLSGYYFKMTFNPELLFSEHFQYRNRIAIGGGKNINKNILHVAINLIEYGRQLRFQPFNQYRKQFGLTPYKSFQELTGETELAAKLEKLYGHIDAMEFYPALLLEAPYENAIFGQSMVEMGAPFSLKGLMGNPICSPDYWKPSTFGGKTGFDIVNTATLKKLVCHNVKNCPYVAFHVPHNIDDESERGKKEPSTEL